MRLYCMTDIFENVAHYGIQYFRITLKSYEQALWALSLVLVKTHLSPPRIYQTNTGEIYNFKYI
jgi:hypothetical protein